MPVDTNVPRTFSTSNGAGRPIPYGDDGSINNPPCGDGSIEFTFPIVDDSQWHGSCVFAGRTADENADSTSGATLPLERFASGDPDPWTSVRLAGAPGPGIAAQPTCSDSGQQSSLRFQYQVGVQSEIGSQANRIDEGYYTLSTPSQFDTCSTWSAPTSVVSPGQQYDEQGSQTRPILQTQTAQTRCNTFSIHPGTKDGQSMVPLEASPNKQNSVIKCSEQGCGWQGKTSSDLKYLHLRVPERVELTPGQEAYCAAQTCPCL